MTRGRGTAATRGGDAAEREAFSGVVGLLGGTFDPVHVGHLALAHAALEQLALDRVVFVPAARPPHKLGEPISPAQDRLAMVAAAIEDEPRFAVSRAELDRPGPSFTVDTVEEIVEAARAGGRPLDLTLVMSAEAFAELPTWHEPRRLLELARIAVGPRPGHAAPDPGWLDQRWPELADRVTALDMPLVEVSASHIRARVAADRPIEGLVPPPVAAYIQGHDLYRKQPIQEGPAVTDPIEQTPSRSATRPRPRRAAVEAAPNADGLPKRGAKTSTSERPPLEVARRIVELAEDKKAADIILLDLAGLTTVADAFVICSGGSERQLEAIADGVLEGMRAEKIRPIGREGTAASHWVLVDFGSVVVHIFTPPERDYYSLEKHWAEARTVLRVQ